MNEVWILQVHGSFTSRIPRVLCLCSGLGLRNVLLACLAQNSWSGDNNLFPHLSFPLVHKGPEKELQVLMLVKLNSF